MLLNRTPGSTPVVPQPETPGNTTPTAQTLRALAAGNVQVSSSPRVPAPRTSVRFARVVNSAKGTRYLSLRLKGTKRTATVRIQLMGYNGKVVRTITRTVAVGRTVELRNVRLGANIRSARVAVVNR